jgi:hypothetical protein
VPVVKRRKNAQEEEEDETYEQVSASDEEETDPEEEVLEEEEEEVQYESDSPSNDEEELPSTSKSLREVAMDKKKLTAKRKIVPEKKATPIKKVKLVAAPEKKVKRIVKKVAQKVTKEKPTSDENKKTSNSIEYNDKNVDFNLYNEAPEHIKNVKIKISSNVVMICRMIEATGNTSQGLTYDYAALSFVRQSKNGRAYEFNLPLNLAPSITKGINLMIKENTKFFAKQIQKVPDDELE